MLDPIFNKYKTLFSILDTMDIVKPNTKNIVLYLNIDSIIKAIFTENINKALLATNDTNGVKLSLVSNILNLAQHYRWYFSKKSYDCKVYAYWNFNCTDYINRKYIDSYRSYYYNKMYNSISCKYITDCLVSSHNPLKIITQYMNQINIINGCNVESSVIPYIIKERYCTDKNAQHIIISTDKYDFQYIKHGFDVLVPKQKNTVLLNKYNIMSFMKNAEGIKSTIMTPYQHLPSVLSLLGCRYRNISKIQGMGLGTIIKLIDKAMNELRISENTSDIITLSTIVEEKHRDKFITNYKCTDIISQYNELSELDIHNILGQIIDKYDDNTLHYINDKYFQDSPLFIVKDHREQFLNETGSQHHKSIFST